MADLVYGSGAVERARAVVAGEARRLPALADLVTAVPASAFGGLGASTAVIGALAELTKALDAELLAAGERLDGLDRALDATLRSMQATDGATGSSLASAHPGG